MQARVAMAAVFGLIVLKLVLSSAISIRDYLLAPPVLAVSLAIFASACWVTWRLGQVHNDTRLLLQVLLGLEVFFFLLSVFVEELACAPPSAHFSSALSGARVRCCLFLICESV
jgi:hypothetical protein